jgi:ferredoxin
VTRPAARLVADAAKCDGHGICALRCPDLLTLDAWGFVGVDTAAVVTGRDLRRAKSAVAACPEHALSLTEHALSLTEHALSLTEHALSLVEQAVPPAPLELKAGLNVLPGPDSSTRTGSATRPAGYESGTHSWKGGRGRR